MQTSLVFTSWLRTRWAMRQSPAQLAQYRERQWQKLQPSITRTPAISMYAGRKLNEFPVTNTGKLRADYGSWNSIGLTDAELRAMADAAENGQISGPVTAGWSSGTSGGTRGLFIAADTERADYIGQSLARLLPLRAFLSRQRVALILRANSALYSAVQNRQFTFMHFPLDQPFAETRVELSAFDPTILIAPPRHLLALADTGTQLPSLRHLFYGSEPMSEAECQHTAKQLGRLPRSIYQATEGFLGASCQFGKLHLNEHALVIELEPVTGTDGFRPIMTDLRRHSQPIVRIRGDDYLELDSQSKCACGYSGRIIRPVLGRVSNIWRFPARSVTPSEVTTAVEAELKGNIDWQAAANQTAIFLRVATDCPSGLLTRAANRLQTELCLQVPITATANLPPWDGPKRQKVIWLDD